MSEKTIYKHKLCNMECLVDRRRMNTAEGKPGDSGLSDPRNESPG